jgi:hypothetical protein
MLADIWLVSCQRITRQTVRLFDILIASRDLRTCRITGLFSKLNSETQRVRKRVTSVDSQLAKFLELDLLHVSSPKCHANLRIYIHLKTIITPSPSNNNSSSLFLRPQLQRHPSSSTLLPLAQAQDSMVSTDSRIEAV